MDSTAEDAGGAAREPAVTVTIARSVRHHPTRRITRLQNMDLSPRADAGRAPFFAALVPGRRDSLRHGLGGPPHCVDESGRQPLGPNRFAARLKSTFYALSNSRSVDPWTQISTATGSGNGFTDAADSHFETSVVERTLTDVGGCSHLSCADSVGARRTLRTRGPDSVAPIREGACASPRTQDRERGYAADAIVVDGAAVAQAPVQADAGDGAR